MGNKVLMITEKLINKLNDEVNEGVVALVFMLRDAKRDDKLSLLALNSFEKSLHKLKNVV